MAAQIIVFAQAIVGVALQSKEDIEPDDFHYLYGFSMIIAIAFYMATEIPSETKNSYSTDWEFIHNGAGDQGYVSRNNIEMKIENNYEQLFWRV